DVENPVRGRADAGVHVAECFNQVIEKFDTTFRDRVKQRTPNPDGCNQKYHFAWVCAGRSLQFEHFRDCHRLRHRVIMDSINRLNSVAAKLELRGFEMNGLSRRAVLSGGVAVLTAPMLRRADAQAAYPNRPVKMIVPWPPGGVTDVTGRVLAQRLTVELGQAVVVENRPGAAGTIGHAAVAQSDADGYTLLLATNSTYAMAPHLFDKLPYDNDKAFVGVGLVV